MDYPDSVIAVNKKGKKEVRVLIDKGEYVRYGYIDLKTGKQESKTSIILNNKEHFFIIPLKDGKSLLVKKEYKSSIKVWDKDKKKPISID